MTQVDVYWNIHKNQFSVRSRATGRVTEHAGQVVLRNARFVVQPAGRRRVLATGVKNVHAFVRGELVATDAGIPVPDLLDSITYNPARFTTFVDRATLEPVLERDIALCTINNGRPAVFGGNQRTE